MFYQGDDLEKIKIIDRAFNALSLDEVKHIFGADVVVDKLKGTPDRDGPLAQAAKELQSAAADISMFRSDIMSLKVDIQTLVRCLNKGMGDSAVVSDFNNLKQRHGVY